MKKSKYNVLLVDDEKEIVNAVKELLERNSYNVITAYSAQEAIEKTKSSPDINFVLIDLMMTEVDSDDLLMKLKAFTQDIPIVIVSSNGSIDKALKGMKRGASDYITKPYNEDLLLKKLDLLRSKYELEARSGELKKILSDIYGFENIISNSLTMDKVFQKGRAAACSNAPVLIVGQTGTGKELLAKAIHMKGERSEGPFIAVNCGAIPKELIESELFGYKKGAFTGALKDYEGLFMSADKGTIFLDEIGEMPKELQVRLLRVLEEYKVRPIGHTKEIPLDMRVIAASNRPIEVLKGRYLREDLFFRLAVIVIELPCLNERKGDLPILTATFIKRFNLKYSKNIKALTMGAIESLYQHEFTGNIRELENLIEGIIALCPEEKVEITENDLKSNLLWHEPKTSGYQLLNLEKLEKFAIEQALRKMGGNKSKASLALGISRDTLNRKMKLFGIQKH